MLAIGYRRHSRPTRATAGLPVESYRYFCFFSPNDPSLRFVIGADPIFTHGAVLSLKDVVF